MERLTANALAAGRPRWSAFLELLKPITWFPPMWAFGCGIISSGASLAERWPFALAGALLAGPLVCGTSQVVNDWFDRDVDAINEPHRPIPSGRAPGQTALYFAIVWTALSVIVASFMGPWVTIAAIAGLALAWAYSAPPFRLKQNGWWGNAAVGLCYEGLPWFTAVAAVTAALPSWQILVLALLYSIGAHGIMTLNDFKAVEGDRIMGVRSLPVQLGVNGAARLACAVMALPQLIVVALLVSWQAPIAAGIVALLLATQLVLMKRFLSDPTRLATWFSGFGVALYVLGMLASAFAVRAVIQAVAA
ncbi:MAG: chlorophyll synthase ChlG [Woeseiaceae bacterium]|nr:chlorophyll synthase ChlG [Woeseiaceae bacterium]